MSRQRRQAAALGLVAVCLLTLTVGWWSKARCLADDGAWTNGEQYTAWCYTDYYPLYFAKGLSEGATPYQETELEYPVLTGAQLWLGGELADALSPEAPGVAVYHLSAAGSALALLGVLGLLAAHGLGWRRLLWWAAAPTLAFAAFINWDALPILLMVAALWAHRTGRDGLAGVAAGLGTAAKLFPGIVVPVVVAARVAQGRTRAALLHAGAAAGAWLVVNAPIAATAPQGWVRFYEFSSERVPSFETLWHLVRQVREAPLPVETVNAGSAFAFLAGAVVIAVVGAARREPDRWWELVLPLLAWFLLTNKVYSPQFSLWLIPLMALALPRFAPFAAFAVADVLVFATVFPFLAGQSGLDPAPPYGVLGFVVVVRAMVLAWIVALSTWSGASRPERWWPPPDRRRAPVGSAADASHTPS
jgi:uncharacterized membrane protein